MIRKFAFVGMTAAASLMAGLPAQAETLRMIGSWAESNTMAYMPGARFKENLEEQGIGLDVDIFGPETVPAFEQIDPVSAGVFDVIYTHPAYHDRAITNATNGMKPDMELIRSSGVFDEMDSYLQENLNLKLLANVSVGTGGYHCYLREALDEGGTWQGRRIRGISTYVPVIEALGGVAVNTPMGEVYSALERGVVDGACAPVSVFRGTRHFEVAQYRTEPTFGQLVSYIAMNLDTWNRLSEEQQQAVTEASILTEQDSLRIGDEFIDDDLAWLEEQGVQVTAFGDEAYEQVLDSYRDGLWNLVASCCGQDESDLLREMATDAGLIE